MSRRLLRRGRVVRTARNTARLARGVVGGHPASIVVARMPVPSLPRVSLLSPACRAINSATVASVANSLVFYWLVEFAKRTPTMSESVEKKSVGSFRLHAAGYVKICTTLDWLGPARLPFHPVPIPVALTRNIAAAKHVLGDTLGTTPG